jgi:hypothetical protein
LVLEQLVEQMLVQVVMLAEQVELIILEAQALLEVMQLAMPMAAAAAVVALGGTLVFLVVQVEMVLKVLFTYMRKIGLEV